MNFTALSYLASTHSKHDGSSRVLGHIGGGAIFREKLVKFFRIVGF